jgi:hypothetical protein
LSTATISKETHVPRPRDARRLLGQGLSGLTVARLAADPDKATRDAGWARMMAEEDSEQSTPMPFDSKRMFWGGFRPILDTAAE